jgi:hypothetical protein
MIVPTAKATEASVGILRVFADATSISIILSLSVSTKVYDAVLASIVVILGASAPVGPVGPVGPVTVEAAPVAPVGPVGPVAPCIP